MISIDFNNADLAVSTTLSAISPHGILPENDAPVYLIKIIKNPKVIIKQRPICNIHK